uniref:MFS transporter n=1 Tax=Pseudomaricurvus sp. TaxID=2004510 RepID=UPI003F6AB906
FWLAVVAVLVAVTPYVLRLSGWFFENDDPWLLPALFGLQAVYATSGIASATLVHAMIGDVIDESSLRTGRRAEGLFYAANSFMQKCVSGLGVLVAGLLLAAVNMPEGASPGELDPAIIRSLVLIYIPSITVLYIVGASMLAYYRIDRASHEANVAELRLREEQR